LLTKQDVEELLARRTENKSLDFKELLNWAAASAAEKGAVVKDVLAMSNTQSGGKIVFGVRDHDFEPLGLSETDVASFDPTRFSDFVNRYADPPIEFSLYKYSIQGMRIVAVDVPEFSDVPVVCKADLNDSNNRQVLKRGAT
jgi:predicted HTH transcriptional regulator